MITASVLLLASPLAGLGIGPSPRGAGPDTSCIVMDMSPDGRVSPLDSLSFTVGGHTVKVCYGRPSSRGRTMIGGRNVPYGKLWRTGANEPTMIHTTGPITVAGIAIDKGSYSLYTVPGEDEWKLIVNRSITQWGHIARYTRRVRAQEVGRATIPREQLDHHVETLTLRADRDNQSDTTIYLEWEYTRVRIPISVAQVKTSRF